MMILLLPVYFHGNHIGVCFIQIQFYSHLFQLGWSRTLKKWDEVRRKSRKSQGCKSEGEWALRNSLRDFQRSNAEHQLCILLLTKHAVRRCENPQDTSAHCLRWSHQDPQNAVRLENVPDRVKLKQTENVFPSSLQPHHLLNPKTA